MTNCEILKGVNINNLLKQYHGDARVFRNAIGSYILGMMLGWRVLYIISSKRSLRKYEDILHMKFREVMPEITCLSIKHSLFRSGVPKLYWKYVNGELKQKFGNSSYI